MAALPQPTDPTLLAIDAVLEADQRSRYKQFLGLVNIGTDCERKLFYAFRWCGKSEFNADTLKRFEDGLAGEALQARRLRKVDGITLETIDGKGKQFGFYDFSGHLNGLMDGAILGILQAPQTWHVWEHKQCDEKKFMELEKSKADFGEKQALQNWNSEYYAQAVMLMHYSGLERHYLTCSLPGGRSTTSVRTNSDPDTVKVLLSRAERLIFSDIAPSRTSDDPGWYKCRFCDFHSICHGRKEESTQLLGPQALPDVNCRTCLHSTPEHTPNADGTGRWTCARWQCDIPLEGQYEGCPSHRYLPALIPWATAIDSTEIDGVPGDVMYEMAGETHQPFVNGESSPDQHVPYYSSAELKALHPTLIGDYNIQALRETMGGTVAEPFKEPLFLDTFEDDIPF